MVYGFCPPWAGFHGPPWAGFHGPPWAGLNTDVPNVWPIWEIIEEILV